MMSANVGCWPLADVTLAAGDVRYRRVKRTRAGRGPTSANDPKPTLSGMLGEVLPRRPSSPMEGEQKFPSEV
jgi:hypothetical protein